MQMEVKNLNGITLATHTFYNLNEIINDIENSISFKREIDYWCSRQKTTVDEIIDKLKYGDKKILKDFNVEINQDLISNGYCTQKRTKCSFCGGALNIARYLNNDPFCFNRKQKQETLSKIVNIFVDVSTPYYVTNKDRTKCFSKILSFAKSLELKNYRVSITLGSTHVYIKTNDFSIWFLKLKSADELIDLQNMSFVLGDSLFSRTCMFAYENIYHKLNDASATPLQFRLGAPFSFLNINPEVDSEFINNCEKLLYKTLEEQNRDKNDNVLFLNYYSDLEKIKKDF